MARSLSSGPPLTSVCTTQRAMVLMQPEAESTAVRIAIVEDHQLVARGLQSLLEDNPDIVVVGVAPSVEGAIELVRDTRPDVVVMDYRLRDGTGADAARRLTSICEAAVVFLSDDQAADALLATVDAGAAGYILKSDPPEQLVAAVRRAAHGDIVLPPESMRRLLSIVREREQARASLESRWAAMTERERQTLALMAVGRNNRSIAADLGVAFTTARTHVRNVVQKLGAHSKLEAVAIAHSWGLIEDVPRPDVRGADHPSGR
jgi:DNA-binding NarL/FixJ family response regulator